VHTPQFRTLTNQKPDLTKKIKQLIERAEQHRATFLALLAQADEPIKPFTPPELPLDDLKKAAHITRQWLGLDAHRDFAGFRSAIESKGVLVFQSNGYKGDWNIGKENPILGFSLYHDTYPVILIKKQDAVSREAFTLMHELAHLLLHKDSSIDDEQDLNANNGDEREANAFAGYLLVPDEALNTIDLSSKPSEIAALEGWLAPYRKRWGVSSEVLLRRLLDSRRLRQADYTAYREWRSTVPTVSKSGGNREWRHREPNHIFGEGYVNRVLQSLNHRDITLSKASSYLDNLKIPDLQMLERHYAV
jgi:Zn-dependent peptidase ImmA (M78 family)